MGQEELWARVNAAKRVVNECANSDLPYAFRSQAVYLAYTGSCGEAPA